MMTGSGLTFKSYIEAASIYVLTKNMYYISGRFRPWGVRIRGPKNMYYCSWSHKKCCTIYIHKVIGQILCIVMSSFPPVPPLAIFLPPCPVPKRSKMPLPMKCLLSRC